MNALKWIGCIILAVLLLGVLLGLYIAVKAMAGIIMILVVVGIAAYGLKCWLFDQQNGA